jgi:tetratricopeptide (TPR) repeat protein
MRRCLIVVCLSGGFACGQEPAPDYLDKLLRSAGVAYSKAEYEAARTSLEEAWKIAEQLPADDPKRYDVLKRLASVRSAAGEYADAEKYLQMAIHWKESTAGRGHPSIADDLAEVAALCRRQKDFERALTLLQQVQRLHHEAGADHSVIADDFIRMGQIYLDQDDPRRAAGFFQGAVITREKSVGPDHVSLVADLDRLAAARLTLTEYDQAEAAFRRALIIRERLMERDDPSLIPNVDGLAYALFGQKKYPEAGALYQRLLSIWIKSAGPDHPMVAMTLDKLAMFYREQERLEEGQTAADRANAIRAHFYSTGLRREGDHHLARGEKREAIAMYRRAIEALDPGREEHQKAYKEISSILKGLGADTKPAKKAARKKRPPAAVK